MENTGEPSFHIATIAYKPKYDIKLNIWKTFGINVP